ncbi:TetR family copper-responsive transcriptional repressor ComR [Paenibacillus vulneris]|uniref:TetR/AcrR family transcriptional regulator n=1 Tax=Paenibacillus vulneris TaxID=1133364 RepID=A0ABW3UDU7_9BACL|nr:TetR/AcrR family transcriptional regulator [Paenibacillus sp. 32352]
MARSKQFEENAVLEKAMKLFWEQGYEKTSMQDLVENMGIHRRSLYDTFSDKRTLFLKAVERFDNRVDTWLKSGVDRSETARGALRFIFDFMIYGQEDAPPGCMIVNSAVELAARDPEIDAKTQQGFAKMEHLLEGIIARGQRDGEFNTQQEAKLYAEFLHNSLVGLRVLARTTAPKEKLERIAAMSLSLLEKGS